MGDATAIAPPFTVRDVAQDATRLRGAPSADEILRSQINLRSRASRFAALDLRHRCRRPVEVQDRPSPRASPQCYRLPTRRLLPAASIIQFLWSMTSRHHVSITSSPCLAARCAIALGSLAALSSVRADTVLQMLCERHKSIRGED